MARRLTFQQAINEALEVAKKFSTHESSRFINGILDAIRKKLERE